LQQWEHGTPSQSRFYWGDDATREAAKDHQESPPPNDYYIRNSNSRLRTLPVRADAPITCNTLTAGYTGSVTKNVRVPLWRLQIVLLNTDSPPFWITVDHGQVVRIAEQYVPQKPATRQLPTDCVQN
jgi:hypothetical protein